MYNVQISDPEILKWLRHFIHNNKLVLHSGNLEMFVVASGKCSFNSKHVNILVTPPDRNVSNFFLFKEKVGGATSFQGGPQQTGCCHIGIWQ